MINFLKPIFGLFLSLVLFQYLSFQTLAKSQLPKNLGKNYETNIFNFKNNQFDNIHFVSELPLTEPQIQKHFKPFKDRKIACCTSFQSCPKARNDFFYIYGIFIDNESLFSIITIYHYNK